MKGGGGGGVLKTITPIMIKVSDPPHSLYELKTVNHSCSQTHF